MQKIKDASNLKQLEKFINGRRRKNFQRYLFLKV